MKTARYIGLGVVSAVLLLLVWNGCGGGASSNSGGTPAPPPPPKFHGSAYTVGSVINATTSAPEAEEVISIDPNNRMNLVAMITDFSQPQNLGAGRYSISSDGGTTWSDAFVPESANTPTTSDGQVWQDNRDPSLGIDKSGNVFLSGIYAQPPQSGVHSPSGVYVCVGTLPSVTLTAPGCRPVYTNTSANDVFGEDKDTLAVDTSGAGTSGNVYVTWIHFTNCTPSGCGMKFIAVSRSTDHGVTWSVPLMLTSGTTDVEWPQMAVGSDGTVYVSFEVFLGNNQAQHMLAMSTDGGQTFSTPTAITPIYADVMFSTSYRINSGPNLVVSPVNGAEYVYDVYATQNGAGSDIVVTRSNQPKGAGGFTTPISVNDSTAGQRIFPSTAVDSNGVLHMAWFDTRNASGTGMFDIYATYSKDFGATFAPNARVTPASIPAGTFMGDYAGMAAEATSGVAHPVWTSGGSSGGMLQTVTLTAP
ncbi:MAG TPA: hypothetical protein VJQ82_07845 [Terriglobales bacterium]|nr:hypothetical protein [Terriglobales bacterium]